MKNKFTSIILAIIITFTFSACQKSEADKITDSTLPTISVSQIPSPTQTPAINSPIRKIDFENFKYPWTEDLSSPDDETFTLKKGERPFERNGQMGISLGKIEYADVTNDGEEDAIMSMSVQTGGSSMPSMIYIYTLQNNSPKLLWHFDTGDRAEGGLKNIYAASGNFIIELFGDDQFENGEWKYDIPENKFKGLCCPTVFTKFKFKWTGEKFVEAGKPALFDYDNSNARK